MAVRYYNDDTGDYLYMPPAAYLSSALDAATMVSNRIKSTIYSNSLMFTNRVILLLACNNTTLYLVE